MVEMKQITITTQYNDFKNTLLHLGKRVLLKKGIKHHKCCNAVILPYHATISNQFFDYHEITIQAYCNNCDIEYFYTIELKK